MNVLPVDRSADEKADFESLEAYKEFLYSLDDIAEFRDKKGDKYSETAKRINTFSYPSRKTSAITREKGVPFTIAGNELLKDKEYKDEYFSNNPSHEIIKADGTKDRDLAYWLNRESRAAEGATFLEALVAEFEVLTNKEAEGKISEKEQGLLDAYRVFLTERTGMNEGGMAMNDQMNAVFKSSRTKIDSVSGNEVPPGSMPEEVRDDIDARLSEGEYVVPADVVRYFGVKLFEDLRIQAKRGMAQMDAEGRIGGEPMSGMEIVEPEDDLPFNMEDLEVVEVMEMDEGGDVGYARRGMITSGDPDSPMGALGLGTEGLGIGATSSNVEMKKYVNEDGHSLMIMFINGVPQQVIPAGYFLEETEAVTTEEEDTTTDTDAEEITSAASSRDDDDPFKDIPMPEGVNYKELTYDEMVAMVKDNQSMKGDLVSTGMGIVNPILGIIVKLALMNSKRQLENEMKRRLDSKTLTAQEQSNLADLLKSSQEGRTGFMRALFGDEATTEAYTPIVTSGAPVNTSTVNALAGESSKAAAQKLKDDEAAARRRLAELRGIAASEDVADQVSGSTAGAAGTDPAVGTSDTTTGGVVGGYSTSDLADQYGSYGAGKPKPPGPSAKPYSSISGSNNSSAIESSLQNQNYYNNPSYTRAQPVSGPFNEGGLVKRRKKK
jgi:hypothetical protein